MAPTEGSLIFVRAFLNSLFGEKCWSVIAGPGTGSMASIAFGRQIPRMRPLKNPMLSEMEKEFEGEKRIFIKDAAWTLEYKGRLICTNEDSNDLDGPVVSGLRNLVGKEVMSARLIGKLGEFEVIFGDGYVLRVLHTKINDDADCYSLFDSERAITLSEDGRVVVEDEEGGG